jgi:hypothetical protein
MASKSARPLWSQAATLPGSPLHTTMRIRSPLRSGASRALALARQRGKPASRGLAQPAIPLSLLR